MAEPEIALEPIAEAELPRFSEMAREALAPAFRAAYGKDADVPWGTKEEDERQFRAPGVETFWLVAAGRRVGGAQVRVEAAARRNVLEFFFLRPGEEGAGLGFSAWKRLEARWPEAETWRLVTPVYERRNIHFYVNKCGFHIVAFFHSRHPDPDKPALRDAEGRPHPGVDAYFLFEKRRA